MSANSADEGFNCFLGEWAGLDESETPGEKRPIRVTIIVARLWRLPPPIGGAKIEPPQSRIASHLSAHSGCETTERKREAKWEAQAGLTWGCALPGQTQPVTNKARKRQQGLAETVKSPVRRLQMLQSWQRDWWHRGVVYWTQDRGCLLGHVCALCHLYHVVGERHDSYYICHWPCRTLARGTSAATFQNRSGTTSPTTCCTRSVA